jgi:hypothetical protein
VQSVSPAGKTVRYLVQCAFSQTLRANNFANNSQIANIKADIESPVYQLFKSALFMLVLFFIEEIEAHQRALFSENDEIGNICQTITFERRIMK